METLKQKAKELLEKGLVQVVIGFGLGTQDRLRPIFIRKPEEVERLVWKKENKQNLAVYLWKSEMAAFPKKAIVANGATLRSILQLAAEKQIREENLVVLGVDEAGKFMDFPTFQAIEEYVQKNPMELDPADKAVLEKIDKMSREERWAFWQSELERCFKCYACRASCPLCYCSKCSMECNQPQWVNVAATPMGNLEMHITRAMHLAGRCTECGACGNACPLSIPVHLLTIKMAEDIAKEFGAKPGLSVQYECALSTYKAQDKEDFIR